MYTTLRMAAPLLSLLLQLNPNPMRTFISILTLLLSALHLPAQATADTTSTTYCWGIEEKAMLRLYPSAPAPKKPSAIGSFFKPVGSYRLRKSLILPVVAGFGAGAAWGTHEVVQNHNHRIFQRFPGANPRFWGPESWKNKYWGFDPDNGRNNTLVYFTDAKHLLASTTQVFAFSAGATIMLGEDRPVIHYLIDAGLTFVAYTAGNVLIYNIILGK